MEPIEECKVCRSFVNSIRPNPVCRVCSERTCHNCQRVCDRCLKSVCMGHIESRQIWLNGAKTIFKLCDVCKIIWT